MRKRRVLMLKGLGALCLVMLLFCCVALVASARQRVRVEDLAKHVRALKGGQPSPTRQNVEVLKANNQAYEDRLNMQASLLTRGAPAEPVLEPAGFSARAQGIVGQLREEAEEAGVGLLDSLELGFTPYVSEGRIPAESDVCRLSQQLDVVERVVRLLIDARVLSIDAVVCEPSADGGLGVAGVSGLCRERVCFSFTGAEQSIWLALKGIADSPRFMVLDSFSHTLDADILAYRVASSSCRPSDEVAAFLKEGVLRGDQALPRSERIVAGRERVRVSVTIDCFYFLPSSRELK